MLVYYCMHIRLKTQKHTVHAHLIETVNEEGIPLCGRIELNDALYAIFLLKCSPELGTHAYIHTKKII